MIMKIWMTSLLATVLIACGGSAQKSTEDLSVEEAKAWISQTENEIILDVRTEAETRFGMIEGAVHIDYKGDNFREELNKLDKNKPVLVYCAAGGRSSKTASILKELGFKEVHNLLGGYTAWSE